MPNPVLVMERANLFAGSGANDEKFSNHLVLTMVQFPTMDLQYIDHRPGGSPVAIEIDTIMARFEVKFQTIGIVSQLWSMLLRLDPGANDFYIYGLVRDQMTGETMQAAAFVNGQMAQVAPSPFKSGDVMLTEHVIRGLRRYKFQLGNATIYDWDFFRNVWAVGGFNQSGASTEGAE